MQLLYDFFLWIYVRPIPQLILLVLAVSAGFCLVHRRWGHHALWKIGLLLALMLWAGAAVLLTVTGRESGGAITHSLSPFHSYRELLNGGNPEILRSNFMNGLLFFPAGLLFGSLLPRKMPTWCRILLTLLLFAGFSLGIEYVQFTGSLGNAETDDVIHNTLGTVLGCLCSLISLDIRKRPE